ncbi:conserved hypothetical protein [Sphingomonas sp. 8AM]|nr:conserved hypothetical protein [Sphingomonas sp. 8AM]
MAGISLRASRRRPAAFLTQPLRGGPMLTRGGVARQSRGNIRPLLPHALPRIEIGSVTMMQIGRKPLWPLLVWLAHLNVRAAPVEHVPGHLPFDKLRANGVRQSDLRGRSRGVCSCYRCRHCKRSEAIQDVVVRLGIASLRS